MNPAATKIDYMQKITLALEAGSSAEAVDLTPEAVTFDFIFGIGSQGLTPFEFQVAGLSEGEVVVIPVLQSEAGPFFGYHRPPILQWTAGREVFYLTVHVLRVAPAESREVIKAMADMTACNDCGGDCCGHSH